MMGDDQDWASIANLPPGYKNSYSEAAKISLQHRIQTSTPRISKEIGLLVWVSLLSDFIYEINRGY
jgi:hypothetical protein